MKPEPWSHLELFPRQLPGNVSPDVIAQLDFSDKTTLVPVVWAIVLVEAVLITVVVVSRLMVRRLVIGRLFMDDGMPSPHLICMLFPWKTCSLTLDFSPHSCCQLIYVGILRDHPCRYESSLYLPTSSRDASRSMRF